MRYTFPRRKNFRKVFTKAKKRRSISNISHVKSNDSNSFNSPNSDYVKKRQTLLIPLFKMEVHQIHPLLEQKEKYIVKCLY